MGTPWVKYLSGKFTKEINMADQYMDCSTSLESNEIQLKGGTIFTYQTGTFVYWLFIPVIIGWSLEKWA